LKRLLVRGLRAVGRTVMACAGLALAIFAYVTNWIEE
jgi:hypothetical protein